MDIKKKIVFPSVDKNPSMPFSIVQANENPILIMWWVNIITNARSSKQKLWDSHKSSITLFSLKDLTNHG